MSHAAPAKTQARDAFYKAIEPESMRALWSVMGAIITPEPKSGCQPVMWKYDTVRARLMEAAGPDHREGSRAPGADP
jgi:gentisate 1,2-dioxygenase